MSQSPWSAYGRPPKNNTERPLAGGDADPTFGAAREVLRTQEQLRRYLAHTLEEFNEIRKGHAGYNRIVAEALRPPPRPESIEETLRRLSGTSIGVRQGRNGPAPRR